MLLSLRTRRHNIIRTTVRALSYNRLNPRKLRCRSLQQHSPSKLVIASVNHIMQAFTNVQMRHGGTKNMTRIMQRQTNIRRNIRHHAKTQRNRMQNAFPNVLLIIVRRHTLFSSHIQIIQLKQRHQIRSRRRTINRTIITILVKKRNQTTMVKMRMTNHHRIQRVNLKLRTIKTWKRLKRPLRTRMNTTIKQHTTLASLNKKSRTTNLLRATKHGHSDVADFIDFRSENSFADGAEDAFSFFAF